MAKLTPRQRKWFEYLALKLELHHDNGIRFDLDQWVEDKSYGMGDDGKDQWCGTKGCACGLATLDPTFQQAGFLVAHWITVMEFFEITEQQALYLFSAEYYTGTKTGNAAARKVAKRIREFIAANGRVPDKF